MATARRFGAGFPAAVFLAAGFFAADFFAADFFAAGFVVAAFLIVVFVAGAVRARGNVFTAIRSLAATRVRHAPQRPWRSALSLSFVTSMEPSRTLPQCVVVAKLRVSGACHCAAAGVNW